MSATPNRRARRTAERELQRLHRRLNTQPERPILRTSERDPSPALTTREMSDRKVNPPANSPPPEAPIPQPESRTQHSDHFPLWARLLSVPPDLDPSFRGYLYRYVEDVLQPVDDHEHWLAARIALAMARIHLNATREPNPPTPTWLRYEALADRQLRAAHRELKAYRAARSDSVAPAPKASDQHSQPPAPTTIPPATSPQTPPSQFDPTFVRHLALDAPLPTSRERILAEIDSLRSVLAAHAAVSAT